MARRPLSLAEFNAAYLRMRVDHLHLDELDFELFSRGVVIPPESDKSMSQRRRRLRALLNAESQKPSDNARVFKGDAQTEFMTCRGKFESIREDLEYRCPNKEIYRSRLLHVGSRLQPLQKYVVGEEFSHINKCFGEVVALYDSHFRDIPAPIPPTIEEEEEIGDEDLPDQNPDHEVLAQNQDNHQDYPSDRAVGEDLLNVLLEIRAEIKGVQGQISKNESRNTERVLLLQRSVTSLGNEMTAIKKISLELAKTKQEVAELRKTVSDLQQIIKTGLPRVAVQDPPPSKVELGLDEIPEHDDFPDVQQPTEAPINLEDLRNPTNPNLGGSGLWDNSKNLVQPGYHSQPHFKQPSLPNYTLPSQRPSVGSVEPPAYYRRPQRVADWKIQKYAGNDEGTGLNEFLESVHHYAESEQMSEDELFKSAMHLFTGNALAWYRAMWSQKRLFNWNHLVCELKANFVHPELDATLKMKANSRRQQRNESFQQYYLEMESIFRAMSTPLPPSEKLDLLKRNLRSDYK